MALSLGLLLLACDQSPVETPPPPGPPPANLPVPPCPALPAIGAGFVGRQGSTLILDGQPFRALGANLYYVKELFTYAVKGNAPLADPAREALDHMVCLGARVVRTWAFNDTGEYGALRSGPGQYDEQALVGLDQTVAEAKRRGLRLILTLTNNWAPYGGLFAYADWAGRPQQSEAFFTDATMKEYWKEHATRLATRINTVTGVAYRDEPAILAWEIGNELRCKSCPDRGPLVETVRELARYLKPLVPRHLIADGGDGLDDMAALYPGFSNRYWIDGSGGASFSRLLAVEELDMVSYHFYPRMWDIDPQRDGGIWMDTHERLGRAAGKVVYLGEFADVGADHRRAQVYDQWLRRLLENNHGQLALLWQLIPAARLKDDDGYGFVYDQQPYTAAVLRSWSLRLP